VDNVKGREGEERGEEGYVGKGSSINYVDVGRKFARYTLNV